MEESFSECKRILHECLENPDYADFRYPVNWKEMGLLDYPTVIKQPMDLGTIDKKMNRDVYKTPAEFIYDMRLIYKNCMRYNIETSQLYMKGKQFMEFFERCVIEYKLFDFSFRLNPQKTEEHIEQFKKALLQSRAAVVDAVFVTLQLVCPECLELENPDNQYIDIDKMDGETLDYLLEFLVSMMV